MDIGNIVGELLQVFTHDKNGTLVALGGFAVDGIKQVVALAHKKPVGPDGEELTPEMVAARFDTDIQLTDEIGDAADAELRALDAAEKGPQDAQGAPQAGELPAEQGRAGGKAPKPGKG